jgi:hypothetical protein
MTKPIIFILAIAAFVSSCKKEKMTMNTFYYTSTTETSALTLFIDDVNEGVLPVIDEKPDPNSATQKATALHIPVPSGSHRVEARKADGTVVSSSKMTFTEHKMGCGGSIGGSSVSANGGNETIMVALF